MASQINLEEPQNEFGIGATGRETLEILVPYSTAKNRLRREGEIVTPLNNNGYWDHMLQLSKRRRDEYGDIGESGMSYTEILKEKEGEYRIIQYASVYSVIRSCM